MRILWHGNAPFAPSGYGEQAGLFLPRFQQLGHDVAVACNYGIQGTKVTIGGVPHYPSSGEWGHGGIAAAARDFGADLVIALHDAWTQKPDTWDDDMLLVAIWAPIDHYPIPPAVLAVLDHERVRPLAMSRFGEDLMTAFKLDPLYVPHGTDTTVFRPQPELRDLIRDRMEIPRDAFLVGMVAANKSNPSIDRKSFAKSFLAFAAFAKTHPDARMYVHSEAQPPRGYGLNLDLQANVTGVPKGHLRFSPPDGFKIGMPQELVATLYQAFDVLLNPSMGEGFGIPILEAQACGVPVITSNHSAMPELTHAGWMVEGDPWWDEAQESYFFDPFVASIINALEEAYEARGDTELRESAVEFAQQYDADVVTAHHWKPALDALAAPRTPSQPHSGDVGRAERRRLERAARKTPAPGHGVEHRKEQQHA